MSVLIKALIPARIIYTMDDNTSKVTWVATVHKKCLLVIIDEHIRPLVDLCVCSLTFQQSQ